MKNVLRASDIKMKVILVLSLVQFAVSETINTPGTPRAEERSIDIGQLNSKPPKDDKADWEKFLAPPYMPAGAKIGNVRELYNSIIREEKTEKPIEIFDTAPWTPMSGHHGHGHDHGHGHGHDEEKNKIKQDARVKKETNVKKDAKPLKPLVKRPPAVGPPIPNSKFIRPAISHSAAAPHSASVSHPHSAAASHPHSAAGSHPHSAAPSHPHSVAGSHPHSAAASHPHSAAGSHPNSAAVSHPHSAAVSHPHSAAVAHPHPATPVKNVQVKKPHGVPPKRVQKPVAQRQPSVRVPRKPASSARNLKASRPLSKTSKRHLKQSAARQLKANQRARSLQQQKPQQRHAHHQAVHQNGVDHSVHHHGVHRNARVHQINNAAVTAAKVEGRNLPAKTIVTSNATAARRSRASAAGKSLDAHPVRRPAGSPPKSVRAPISRRKTVPRRRTSKAKPAAAAPKTKYVFNPLSKEDATKLGVGTILVGSLLAL